MTRLEKFGHLLQALRQRRNPLRQRINGRIIDGAAVNAGLGLQCEQLARQRINQRSECIRVAWPRGFTFFRGNEPRQPFDFVDTTLPPQPQAGKLPIERGGNIIIVIVKNRAPSRFDRRIDFLIERRQRNLRCPKPVRC
jgi:hypothetical protein